MQVIRNSDFDFSFDWGVGQGRKGGKEGKEWGLERNGVSAGASRVNPPRARTAWLLQPGVNPPRLQLPATCCTDRRRQTNGLKVVVMDMTEGNGYD